MLALARAFAAGRRCCCSTSRRSASPRKVVDEVFAAIGRFMAERLAVVLVEQYVHRALATADRAVVLDRGTVAHRGPASKLNADDLARRYLGE